MSASEPVDVALPGMVLRLSGRVGQLSLARSADEAGARASVDQHAAEIRDALARAGHAVTPSALLNYARGFTEASIGRGWHPADPATAPAGEHAAAVPGSGGEPAGEPALDWPSLRLAALCRLFIEAQGLGLAG